MMTSPKSLHRLASVTCALLLPLGATESVQAQDKALDAALGKAIRQAQKKLQKKTKLWRDHSTWAKARIVKSKYFALRTTQSHVYAKTLTKGLDAMGDHFINLLRPDYKWDQHAQILLYPDIATYNTAGDAHGGDHSSIYGSFYGASQPNRPVNASFKSNSVMVSIEVTHSATHQFLARAYPGAQRPTWIEEGLAGYFSLYWDWGWGASEVKRFQDQKSFIPLRTLLPRNLPAYGSRAHHHFMELGMLFNYLLHYKAETRSAPGKHDGPFADYLRKSLQGIDVTRHPVHELLFKKTADLDREFRAFDFGR